MKYDVDVDEAKAYGKDFPWRSPTEGKKFGYKAEYQNLEEVVLFIPSNNPLKHIDDPNDSQILEKPNYRELISELNGLKNKLEDLGVTVHVMSFATKDINFIFQRDLFVPHDSRILIGRPSSRVRALEEIKEAKWFAERYYPVSMTPYGHFETSDFLKTVRGNLYGKGGRSRGADDIFDEYIDEKILVPDESQHLLGVVNPVGDKLLLVRKSVMSRESLKRLEKRGFRILDVPEIEEVVYKQGMNVLPVGNKEILMPNDCPVMEDKYKEWDLTVHTTKIKELRKLAGGIACTVGVLKRGGEI